MTTFDAIPNLLSDEEHEQLARALERTPEEIEAMLRRNDAILYAMHLNNFCCALAMHASREVMPFELETLEDRVNYLIAGSAWKDWLAGNREFAALWEMEGGSNVSL